jgi:putative membrane protein
MEQVAPEMDMWFFDQGVIPLINYISWFLLASFFHLLLKITDTRFENRLAPLLFISQLAFFFILMILFKLT